MTLDGFAVVLDDGRLGFITSLASTITADVRTHTHTSTHTPFLGGECTETFEGLRARERGREEERRV